MTCVDQYVCPGTDPVGGLRRVGVCFMPNAGAASGRFWEHELRSLWLPASPRAIVDNWMLHIPTYTAFTTRPHENRKSRRP